MSKRKRQKSSYDSPFLSPLSTRICIEAPSEVGMWANEPQTVDRNKNCKIQTRGAIRRLSLDNEAFCRKTPRIFDDISCAISPAFSPTFSLAFLPHFLPQFLPHFPRSSPAFLPHFLQHFSRFVLMGGGG